MKKENMFRKIMYLFGIVFLLAVGIVIGNNTNKNIPTTPTTSLAIQKNNVEHLRQRFEEMIELENNYEYEKVYDNFLSSKSKEKIKRDIHINQPKEIKIENKKVISQKWIINDIIIKDNIGYIDRTLVSCFDKNCKNNIEDRSYSDFIYENNDWFDNGWSHVLNPTICIRDEMYEMPEEFKRSISLIIQRLEQTNNDLVIKNASDIRKISNCLNIQYANSEQEMDKAEGLFIFYPSQSLDSFDIKISPKYSVKDDLLTATLLAHEIQHAIDFVFSKTWIKKDCFEFEARAFNMQNNVITAMNKEERDSLISRALVGNSIEATQLMDVYFTIPRFKGRNYHEKALNFVKSSPAYQEQCKINNNLFD